MPHDLSAALEGKVSRVYRGSEGEISEVYEGENLRIPGSSYPQSATREQAFVVGHGPGAKTPGYTRPGDEDPGSE